MCVNLIALTFNGIANVWSMLCRVTNNNKNNNTKTIIRRKTTAATTTTLLSHNAKEIEIRNAIKKKKKKIPLNGK